MRGRVGVCVFMYILIKCMCMCICVLICVWYVYIYIFTYPPLLLSTLYKPGSGSWRLRGGRGWGRWTWGIEKEKGAQWNTVKFNTQKQKPTHTCPWYLYQVNPSLTWASPCSAHHSTALLASWGRRTHTYIYIHIYITYTHIYYIILYYMTC